jgi:alpha/beta superfamily hydrolase
MPEIMINGPAGRIEGRYHHEAASGSPIAIILHPHPQFGGTMNNQVVYSLYYKFVQRKFSTLRFNFRGVGRSQGVFDNGPGELSDAATALDWLQLANPDAKSCWIAGVSFGAWVAMQLLMRRPEIDGFISVAPPANLYDFSFLAPCPSSGLMVNGDRDRVVPPQSVKTLVDKLKTQRGIHVSHEVVPGANHFFEDKVDDLIEVVDGYLTRRASGEIKAPTRDRKEKTREPVKEEPLIEDEDDDE